LGLLVFAAASALPIGWRLKMKGERDDMTDLRRNVPADQTEMLAGNYGDLLQRQKELLEAANRAPKTCDDDETAKRLTDFTGQIAACMTAVMKAHKVEKEPHLRAGQTVDKFFADIRLPLLTFKQTFEGLIGTYQWRKQEAVRLAAEAEKERLAALAETEEELEAAIDQEAISRARPLERSRIHGDLATGSLTIGFAYEIKNEALVPDKFWTISDKLIREHIEAAPKDKAPEPVPGISFTPIYKTRIRA
jgi:hypothetical protein